MSEASKSIQLSINIIDFSHLLEMTVGRPFETASFLIGVAQKVNLPAVLFSYDKGFFFGE